MMNPLISLPVGILGYGVEGQSTLRWLRRRGVPDAEIIVMDRNPVQVDGGVRCVCGDDYLDGLKDCTTVVRSAGVYPMLPELLRFQLHGGLLTSQVELFFEATRARSVIGVTGTLGKGSCVSMIAHILERAQVGYVLGGNFGTAALDLLDEEKGDQIVILELSSFQLITLAKSPHIGVVLQTTSEHLDWHRSVEEYWDAKANLVRWQKPDDYCIAFYDAEGSRWIAEQGGGRKLWFGSGDGLPATLHASGLRIEEACLELEHCKVRGTHQLENMAAAALATRACGIAPDFALEALKTYEGLPYRLQYLGTFGNIDFYNDSYATRPEATIAAIRAMNKPFSLILGGSEKHADFSALGQALCSASLLRGVALIGQTAERLQKTLSDQGFSGNWVRCDQSFEDAFNWCLERVRGGGVVLLSPACASFGLFANYKARGKRFDELVENFRQKAET